MPNNVVGRPRKYKLNEHYFDVIESQDQAYILGLLYADGNHCRKKKYVIRLSLKKDDID